MKILTYPNGPFMVNSYLLEHDSGDSIIIDPGGELEEMKQYIAENHLKPLAVIATHGHIDHVAGVKNFKETYSIPFYINSKEQQVMETLPAQARMFGVSGISLPKIDENLPGQETFELGPFSFTCLSTPGHSPGSISLYIDNVVFSGDALFNLSIGRTDLPGGDYLQLITAIKEKLFTLPGDTHVLSGHGPETTIEYEIKRNPFLQ